MTKHRSSAPEVHPADRLGELITVVSMGHEDVVASVLSDADVATLRHLARRGTPENSLRALVSDLTYLEAWSLAATGEALPWPVPGDQVLKFIAHHLYDADERMRNPAHGMPASVEDSLRTDGLLRRVGPHAPATVRRRLSSWATLHRLRGHVGIFADPTIREAVKRAARVADRRPKRKSERSISRDIIEDVLETCTDGGLAASRDRALILVGFASGGRRRSEIARLKVDQIEEEAPVPAEPGNPDGPTLRCYTISLGRTKTTEAEQDTRVALVGRAAEALAAWLARGGITSGYVFRPVDRWGSVGTGPLTSGGVNGIIKRRLAAAGYDPARYSAHGLRAGYLTQAAKDGVSLPEAMRQSLHRSVQQAARYYNDAEGALSRAARLMEPTERR